MDDFRHKHPSSQSETETEPEFPDQIWEQLTRCGTKFETGKSISLYQNDTDPYKHMVYLLEDGICALTSITKSGEEQVYLYFHARRIMSFNHVLVTGRNREDKPLFSIVTKTPCTIYRIPDGTFRQLILEDTQLNAFLIRTLADNFEEVLIHFHRIQEESAAARLARLLLSVSRVENKKRRAPQFFTYEELSRYLGTHPVTVSRIMARMKKEGWLSKSGREIIIENEPALRRLIESESGFDY